MKIKEKKEWAAAVSWVTFYGKDKARLEALHIDDLRTLANMYGVSTSPTTESGGDGGGEPPSEAELVERVLAFTSTQPDAQIDGQPLDVSSDSSGTGKEKSRPGARGRGAREKRPSARARDVPAKQVKVAHKTAGSTPAGGADADKEGEDSSDSESYSSNSESSSGSGRRPKASKHSSRKPSRQPSSSSAASSSDESPGERDRHTRSLRKGKKSQGSRRETSSHSRSASSYDSDSSVEPEESARFHRSRAKSDRGGRKPKEQIRSLGKKDAARESSSSGPETDSSSESSSLHAGGGSRQRSPGRERIFKQGQSASDKDRMKATGKKDKEKHSARAKDTATHKSSGKQRAKKSSHVSSDSEHSNAEGGLYSDSDDECKRGFASYNSRNKVEVMRGCGCRLCKLYKNIKTARTKDILRGAHSVFSTFRRPSSKARSQRMREWAEMVFWCVHSAPGKSWRMLHRQDRKRIADGLKTGRALRGRKRESHAKRTVKGLWFDSSVIKSYLEKVEERSEQSASKRSPTRSATRAVWLDKVKSLLFNPIEWLEPSEQKELIRQQRMHESMNKMDSGSVPSSFKMPYSSSPWGQCLGWPGSKPMNYEQAGRRLNVALRVWSDQFVDAVEVLARKNRLKADEELFSKFDAAVRTNDFGGVLVCSLEARQHATEIVAGALAEAEAWNRQFRLPLSKEIVEGRARQKLEVPNLFTAVQRSISSHNETLSSEAEKAQFTIGAWVSFFSGMRSGRHNSELNRLTMKRGKKAVGASGRGGQSSDLSTSSGSDSDDSSRAKRLRNKKKREKKKRKKEAPASGASSSARAEKSKASGASADGGGRGGVKCKFRVNFPCSVTILGPQLGVACTAGGACRNCGKMGHWTGECAKEWARNGINLPGYSENGKRYAGEYDANRNPTRATTTEWIRFLKSKKNFPSGGAPALERGAPSLGDFEKWVAKAQP